MSTLIFDCETDALLEGASKLHCLVGAPPQGKAEQVSLDALAGADTLIGHNILGFDLPVLHKLHGFKYTGRVIDTMLVSSLLHADILGGHSLEAWGNRMGFAKGECSDFSVYTPEMLEYCKQDVRVTQKLWEKFSAELREWDWKQALEIEHQFAKDFTVQGLRGIYIDKDHTVAMFDKLTQEMAELAARVEPTLPRRAPNMGELKALTPPTVRYKKDGTLGTHFAAFCAKHGVAPHEVPLTGPLHTTVPTTLKDDEEVKNYLIRCGWQPTYWNFKKAKDEKGRNRFVKDADGELIVTTPKYKSPDGELCKGLEQLAEVAEARDIARWVVIRHRLGMVKGVLERLRPDGTVSATGFPCGTNTGRVRHTAPVCNIPKADKSVLYGAEMRAMFCARPGRVLVGVDASQLELVCLAHYVNNPELTHIITAGTKEDGNDIHTVLNQACQPLVPSRNVQKNVNYGFLYGAGDKKLGLIAGHTNSKAAAVGKKIRAAMVERLAGLEKVMKFCEQAAKRGWVKAIDGRKIEVRMKHAVLNTLLQSCGSIIVKVATIHMNKLIRERKLRAWQVAHVHDEVVLDCHPADAQAAGECFLEGLRYAGKVLKIRAPLTGEIKIGHNWSETH